jgi:excinuclease ABC subunit B
MDFELVSAYQPTGDQPEAIRQLVEGVNAGITFQTLLGVTGSGKTFTMANVIEQVKKPTLILSHNKTLAAQLYAEFKQFFPNNAVEYFVSYYDYYQPEAYIPVTNTYIEKDLSINDEIEKLRLSASSALLSGRRDIIVVASVSCIYGIGNPNEFKKSILPIHVGMEVPRNNFLHRLVENLYTRSEEVFERGMFRVTGDTVDIYLAYADHVVRILFFGDEIEGIQSIDPITNQVFERHTELNLYPANLFVSSPENTLQAIHQIQDDLVFQVDQFKKNGRLEEANRLYERVSYDLEMIRELGYCSGIENYSRYFDNRQPGDRPFCLLDYFPEDYLMMVDESHVTLPQVKGMYGGDRARKINLVEYGFRLQAAIDNRPLKYEEFEGLLNQCVFVSATPAALEIELSEGVMVEQVIRPTGLLDPIIEVRPSRFQIDNLIEEIQARVALNERALVTTLTKRMAEELQKYLTKVGVNCQYIHSDIDTLDRVEILRELRIGTFDVLVGVNLLREGLDLPEVSLVAILDADKEGFLRNVKSLVQTVGRAARNVNGRVIMYADKMTDSMRLTIEETERRRSIQIAYNEAHGLSPQPLNKPIDSGLKNSAKQDNNYKQPKSIDNLNESQHNYKNLQELEKAIKQLKKEMQRAAKELDFILAASIRDQIIALEKLKDSFT